MNKAKKCYQSKIVIHKNDLEIKIYENELQSYLTDGWKKGFSDLRKQKMKNSFKNSKYRQIKKIVVHKNDVEKIVPEIELNDYLNDGWEKGHLKSVNEKISNSLKGNIPWNKNLTKEMDDRVKLNGEKSTETKIKKYGSAFHNNNMNEEHKKKIGDALRGRKGFKLSEEKLKIKLSKDYLTRKKNNTFNSSQSEIDLYEKLLNDFPNKTIYKQYKDKDRYPFYCDFYIVEDDKFIELNAHWTHGGRPYDPNDEFCQKQLCEWQEKAKTSKFYEVAIQTWTVRDVKKLETAKKNNLNYQVIY